MKYKYFKADNESFNIIHSERENRTFIANTDTAEKADFIAKACNSFSELTNKQFDLEETNRAIKIDLSRNA